MYTMNPVDLPPQRAAVLAFLRRELAAGRAPSLADIAGAFGFASRNAAQKHVQALVADGLLEQAPGQKRGLRLPGGMADLLPLPVLGRVAAGQPIGADIGLDEQLWLDRRLFSPQPDYLLKVQGDSMIDDGILDGDLVGVHRTGEARDGQTVVARIVRAYDHAEASLLAPLAYTEMITSVLMGYIFFGDFPDGWTFVGVAILIASAAYISVRERTRKLPPNPKAA